MRVELGKGYKDEDAVAVFATVLRRDDEVDACIVMNAEAQDSGIITEKAMNASAVMAGVDGLKELGMSLEAVMTIVMQAYEEGGNNEPVRTRC